MISVVVVGTTILHGEFLRREKQSLIDQQVRDTATALLDSELMDLRKIEFEKVDRILSEELGENRIGKFFVIRNNAGDLLYESAAAMLLPLSELPRSPRWITIEEKGQYIRLLNLSLPDIPDRTLQVGVVIGEELLAPGYFSKANLFFTAAIMLVGLILAWILTSLLMRPISRLSAFISEVAAENPTGKLELPPLPESLRRLAHGADQKDEFTSLLTGFEKLLNRINRDYRMSRIWSYQMAHELKTPMALIEAKVSQGQSQGRVPEDLARDILVEVFATSETITSFLTWAELENSSEQKRLFVVPISKVLSSLRDRLAPHFSHRLELHVGTDFNVMTNLQHLEHALGNLIMNALIYSPPEKAVKIEASERQVEVVDQGLGFPPNVLERLGEPFNKGTPISMTHTPVAPKGNGLGLALVHSICRIYLWKLEIQSTPEGTRIRIRFPAQEES